MFNDNYVWDGSRHIPVKPKDIKREGWLTKESRTLRQCRNRWVVLTSLKLYTFKAERGGGAYKDSPTEEIDLRHGGIGVHSADEAATKMPNAFVVQAPERRFLFGSSASGVRDNTQFIICA